MSVTIRHEISSDVEPIARITAAAFLDEAHSSGTEHRIVEALRDSGALSVSLVAEDSDHLVGHVALSPVSIEDGSSGWFGLGPICVHPAEQGKGIGSKLMHQAIVELKKLKANGCVLLGSPDYYHRFGFKPVAGLILPDVPPEYFQALLFQGAYPKGEVAYHESFLAQ